MKEEENAQWKRVANWPRTKSSCLSGGKEQHAANSMPAPAQQTSEEEKLFVVQEAGEEVFSEHVACGGVPKG